MSSNLNVNNHQENNHLENNHQENNHQNSQQESNHCLIDNKNDDYQLDCNIDNNLNNVINDNLNNVKQMNKVERIREYINQCISDKSKKKISNIINNVIELTDIEKALLYLSLPTGSSSQESENLKINKPGNPFGKKADSEVSQTFIWIKTHLEEDQNVSLPKHEVYDEYKLFCESNQSQPVCQADFGKLMKHLFPNVKPRRLGQRGNSRYCYSGLRKKTNFDRPELPDVFVLKDRNNDDNLINNKINKTTNLDQQLSLHISNDKNLIQSASSYVVLEWARKFFDHKLTSIKDLAKHLINLNHIDKKSMAALTLIASDDDNIPNDNEFQNLHNDLNQTNQFVDNNLIKGKKNSEDLKIATSKHKSTTDNLTFKRSIDTQKKDRQIKKKLDKEFMKSNSLNKINKSIDTAGKLPKLIKIKKTRIKKENLRNDKLNSRILDEDKLIESETKIKLESFGDLTTYKFTPLNNPIEINKIKNQIHEENNNQFINNTQQFKSTSNFDQLNLKRRHSTTGFHYSNRKQFDNQQIVDDLNYKYQLKRQTSEHFDSTNKKSNLEQSTNLNLQSTNYLTNELNSAKANNQLISYKKCFDINSKFNIINNDNSTNLIQQQNENQSDSLNTNNILNQTISTQVNEQELYQLNNNLFNNNNQLINSQSINNLNQNDIFIPKSNLINNYNNNETVANGMCNVNTQMPSIPASPINQTKDSFSVNQFQQTTNQIINDKLVDFNNNLSTITANIQQNYSTSTYTDEQIQINNCQHLNNNNQKMFVNPSNQQSLLNKNSINNRPLNRVRHSSGPSYTYSSMLYNSSNPTNNFLSNNNLINTRSNSLSPLYENCSLDNNNHKMINFNNVSNFQQQYSSNNNSMKFTFASNPTSPVSEPISPNMISNKKIANLRFSKFNNFEQTTKKDGIRSASFAGSSEPFHSFARTRQRHMSSPYILLPNINSNNDFSNSTQSLTNSTSFTNSNSTATFNSNNDVFIQHNSTINMIDDHNSNTNNLNNMNNIAINQTNLQDNYVSLINSNNKPNYEYPLSPPLTSNIIGEEKSFNNHHLSMDLQNNNSIASSNFNQSIQEFQNNINNNNLNFTNLMNTDSNVRSLNEQTTIDDLQVTLQDLKEICDKDL